jgi:hypothetical protein
MNVTCNKTDNGWEAEAIENGKIAATLSFKVYGTIAVIHNTVHLWTPRALRFYRKAFDLVKKGMKETGIKTIITGNKLSDDLSKKEKYWRMMGFNTFKNFEWEGNKVRCAGQEL